MTAGHAIPAHRPFLMLEVRATDNFFPTGTRQPDLYFETSPGKQGYRRYAVFFLDNQSIPDTQKRHCPSSAFDCRLRN
jgi:hypothetical protein